MEKKIRFITISLIIVFLNNCGFKIIDNTNLKDYNITSIETNNNKRIDFLLKQKIKRSFTNKEASNQIVLMIDNVVTQGVTEKNIKNQVTKYRININTKVKIIVRNTGKIEEFETNNFGSYEVGDTQATTINNKKTLEELLVKKISKNIINQIVLGK